MLEEIAIDVYVRRPWCEGKDEPSWELSHALYEEFVSTRVVRVIWPASAPSDRRFLFSAFPYLASVEIGSVN